MHCEELSCLVGDCVEMEVYVRRYHRILSLLRSFNDTMEDIRISCRSANRSVLG